VLRRIEMSSQGRAWVGGCPCPRRGMQLGHLQPTDASNPLAHVLRDRPVAASGGDEAQPHAPVWVVAVRVDDHHALPGAKRGASLDHRDDERR